LNFELNKEQYRKRVDSFISLWFSVKHQLNESKYSTSIFDNHILKDEFNSSSMSRIFNTINDNVKERKRNSKYPRFNVMRRVRKYWKFNFEVKKGVLINSSKRIDLSNFNIKELISKENRHSSLTKELLPLPITKYCKLVGTISKLEKVKRDSVMSRSYDKDYDIYGIISKFSESVFNNIIDKNIKVFSGH